MRLVHAHLPAIRRVTLALGLSVALGSLHGAQPPQDRGSIAGTVLDPVGTAAAKVLVQANSTDGDTVRRATSPDHVMRAALVNLRVGGARDQQDRNVERGRVAGAERERETIDALFTERELAECDEYADRFRTVVQRPWFDRRMPRHTSCSAEHRTARGQLSDPRGSD
jgi:hypothetical protein